MDKILAAMSGGVDSSVAALQLLEQGHTVAGVMLRLFDERAYGVEAPGKTCCSIRDIEDARNVALKLRIPFQVFNYSELFYEKVILPFARGYSAGLTPNPCLDCNRYIKFDALLSRAVAMGFTAVATGHYARVEYSGEHGRWLLKRAAYAGKDQSYVLYTLTQAQLACLRLPLGEMPKEAVRAVAEQAGFRNAQKADSQDICFVPDGNYAAFLARECGIVDLPGDFVDTEGNRLGRHRGITHYTVGQRRGLGVSGKHPLYVQEIDVRQNKVVLGGAKDLEVKRFLVAEPNWIAHSGLHAPARATVRTRYHQEEAPATLYPAPNGQVLVEPDSPLPRPAPGQAAVFYREDVVLGGGTVTNKKL